MGHAMKTRMMALAAVLLAAVSAVWLGEGLRAQPTATGQAARTSDWRKLLDKRVAAYGHRNWIVIADSAYPAQSRAGVETVVTHADQLEVVRAVLDTLKKTKHLRPNVYLDAELPFVPERDAAGIDRYRDGLKEALSGRKSASLPHEQILDRLDTAGQKFQVLILKTDLALPYTSVFLELDCGYWSAESEQRLRHSIGNREDR
jgi:hypothetical protein